MFSHSGGRSFVERGASIHVAAPFTISLTRVAIATTLIIHQVEFSPRRLRRIAAVDGHNVPSTARYGSKVTQTTRNGCRRRSTAIERVRTLGRSQKSSTEHAVNGRYSTPLMLDFWDRSPRSHTLDRGRSPSTAATRRKWRHMRTVLHACGLWTQLAITHHRRVARPVADVTVSIWECSIVVGSAYHRAQNRTDIKKRSKYS